MALWQGVNQGLQTGLGIADRIQQKQRQDQLDAERADDRTYQRGRQEKADAASARAAQRAEGLDGLKLAEQTDKEAQQLALAGAAAGGLSNEQRTQLDGLKATSSSMRGNARKLLGYEERAQQAKATIDEIDRGTPLANIPGDRLGDAISYTFGHPASSFLDRDNTPSEIGKAYAEFAQGMESGDMNALLTGANTMLRPEIEQGVGTKNAKGETIVGKRAIGVYPSARDPKKGVMDLAVTAQREDGTTYEYPAWMTKDRGPAKGGDEHEFDIEPVLNRINAYGELLGKLNDPQNAPIVQQKVAEWEKVGGAERWKALRAEYIAAGGEAKDFDALKGKQTHETKNRGGYDEDITYDENGNEVSRKRVERTPTPKERDPLDDQLKRAQINRYNGLAGAAGGRGGGGGIGSGALTKDIAEIERQVKEGTITEIEGDDLIRDALSNRAAGNKQSVTADTLAKEANEILKDMRTENPMSRPTFEDALAEAKRRRDLINPPPPPKPKPPGGLSAADRATVPPLRTQQPSPTVAREQAGNLPAPKSPAELAMLPAGTRYTAPDGSVRVRTNPGVVR